MDRQSVIRMLGQRQGMPRWVDYLVQRRNGWCWCTGKEADSHLEGSIMEGGEDRGGSNNSFVTIINIS